MPITLDQIVEQTRDLPPDTVDELIERILTARRLKSEVGQRIGEIKTDENNGARLK
jgi:hypothetical protein